ncbi:hypothetical protein KP509_33G005700 [Ceratopteris richardii]|uniref:Late embryogenesis abundant protein LEA-2 subgroup domain-containing protein n=1 Tax=Ceratopteris richardii TaxID=49495 RepID=A0A8T2QLT6_CERRI|nr:hypothetical protein KP509_33G005700 [Ceratopteris richardii]
MASSQSGYTTTASSPMTAAYPYYVQSPRDSTASTTTYPSAANNISGGGNGGTAAPTAPTNSDQGSRYSPFSSAPSSPLINLLYHQSALGEPLHYPFTSSSFPSSRRAQQQHLLPHPSGPRIVAGKWETLYEDSDSEQASQRSNRNPVFFWCRVYFVALVFMLSLAFLVLWLACRPKSSIVEVQRFDFLDVELMHGTDRTLVPTDLVFIRSQLTVRFRNPSKYFRMVFDPVNLSYSYLGVPLAHGKVPSFRLDQDATHSFRVPMDAEETPIYGAGPSFESSQSGLKADLKIVMDYSVGILWNAVRRRFSREVSCVFVLNVDSLQVQHLSCT